MNEYIPQYDTRKAYNFLMSIVKAGYCLTGSGRKLGKIYHLKLPNLPPETIDYTLNQAFRLGRLTKRDKELLILVGGLRPNSDQLELEEVGIRLNIPQERVWKDQRRATKKLVFGPVEEIAQTLQDLVTH